MERLNTFGMERVREGLRSHSHRNRQRGAITLYRMLEKHVLVDLNIAKKFRCWQNRVLQEKVFHIKRRATKTLRKYLAKRLELLGNPMLKLKLDFFESLKASIPSLTMSINLKKSLSVSAIAIITCRAQAKDTLENPFRIHRNPSAKASLCFQYWKTSTYSPSPFLKRHLVLILSTGSIVRNRNFKLILSAWNKLTTWKSSPKALVPLKLLEKLVLLRTGPALLKMKTPKAPARRRWEDPSFKELYKRKASKAAIYILENIILKKLNIERAELLRMAQSYFVKWKVKTMRSMMVPNFVRKRQIRKWSVLMIASFVSNLSYRLRLSSWDRIKSSYAVNECEFPIDSNIIKNQAKILVMLEEQLKNRTSALALANKKRRVVGLKLVFLEKVRNWLARWRDRSGTEVDKEKLFKYLNELENQVSDFQEGFEGVRRELHRKSSEEIRSSNYELALSHKSV